MRTLLYRIIGSLLILAAIGGFLLSASALVGVWQYKTTVTEGLIDAVVLIRETLDTTAEGLKLSQESLEAAVAGVRGLQSTMSTTARTIQSTEPMVESMVQLLEEDLPNTLIGVQNSLDTAGQSAEIIDTVLRTLDRVPFLNFIYDPQVPLHEALLDVSDSLNAMPDSFATMADSMEDTRHNLQIMQVDLALIIDSIRQIETSLEQFNDVLEQYLDSVDIVQRRLTNLEEKLPSWVDMATYGVTIFFLWMLIMQIGLFIQGMDVFARADRRNDPAQPSAKDPEKET